MNDKAEPKAPAPSVEADHAAELLAANEQLVLATMRAQAAEEQLRLDAHHKDDFLAMLGHELRNPLVSIRNAAEVLHRSDDKRQWVYDVLVRQVGHMTRLVDDLVDISLISRGAMQLRLARVDVSEVIRQAVETIESLINRKRHRLHCELPIEPTWVEADAIRLTQVFENLLTNAAKYTHDEGEISIRLEVVGKSAVIRVRDNGIGISPGMDSRIFELFVQDARAADRSEGGLGIGLALVRHLVDLHSGTIEAISEGVGKGTEFVVRLPLLLTPNPPAEEAITSTDAATGRVMIVDDDVDAGETMAMLLRLSGHAVQRATGLKSALQVGQAFRPQIVLMDISMPDADGYEVARRLSALPEIGRDVVYIAVTGFAQPNDFKRSADAGFAHHLIKPINPEELDKILRQALIGR
ncbi:MAG: hybrid sensor histidine kinase/response regulator [Pseudomonadota bacterium]|nr:hybrid sensor histidine kinase/response regulator [Pseudomonadota bacterium]